MLAIIDGGSTKADWKILLSNKSVLTFTTTGFNPNYDSQERITYLLKNDLAGVIDTNLAGKIYYYGAGCWDTSRKSVVKKAMSAVLPFADIQIEHDLLAAARATSGDSPGIACILGTGSNSVLYDGKEEIDNVTNLGFLLGDEGSGSMIGKRLVQAYFYREMPDELHPIMETECPAGKMDILDKVYGGGVPAAYLATFTKLFYDQRKHPFIWNIIKECFSEFINRHVVKYANYRSLPVHFVGSVAFHFHEVLKELFAEKGLNLGVVLQKPIDALFDYHLLRLEEPIT
ncbi:MAG: hypothetical protein R2825_19850 [Saprospiraceae bacterium]